MFPLDSLNLPRGSAELEKHVRPNVPLKESVHIFKTWMLLRYIVQYVLSLSHTHLHTNTPDLIGQKVLSQCAVSSKVYSVYVKVLKKMEQGQLSKTLWLDWIHNPHFSKEKALRGTAEPSIYAEITSPSTSTNAQIKSQPADRGLTSVSAPGRKSRQNETPHTTVSLGEETF